MITKEVLQKFVDDHIEEIGEVLPGGIKTKEGKWLLICPVMERYELDFSKADLKPTEEVVEEPVDDIGTTEEVETSKEEVVEEKPKKKRSKKNK